MALPIQISPNPLISSLVEFRFTSNVSDTEILSTLYPIYASDFPTFKNGLVPKELKKLREDLNYAPDFILTNDRYTISFSNNVLTFENTGEYTLWSNYFPFIKEQFAKFASLGITEFIERIGIRYASVFETAESINEILTSVPPLNYDEYNYQFEQFRGKLKKNNIDLVLQLFNLGKAQKGNISKSGPIIDIDASYSISLEINNLNNIFEIIDNLHSEQKKFFFSLIKEDFLNKLNPIY